MRSKPLFSSSQALFSIFFLVFFLTLLNGYLQNLVADYRANTWLTLAGVIIELAVASWLARGRVDVQRDPLEIAGFLLVVVGVWLYFIAPALPTLLPPTQSSDAARAYLQVMFSYPEGKLVSWYPAGGAFVVAMFAHWIGWAPLRVLHPTAASFLALGAGAVYGMTCALLPQTRIYKIAAFLAPALLFVPWSYFAGTLNWEQYFFAQVFAQYFVFAALWYTASYAERPHWIYLVFVGAALLGVIAAYPVFAALPLALFAWTALARIARARDSLHSRSALLALGVFLALMVLAAIALERGGVLELVAGYKSAQSDVGPGGVANPSLENLGGPIFLLLALAGVWLAWRKGAFGKAIVGFLFVWSLQLAALLVIQPYFPISGYRIDKTFYILVFPLAILAALLPARGLDRFAAGVAGAPRVVAAGLIATTVVLGAGVLSLRPPQAYALFTESELQVALWAKEHLDTYQVNYLDPRPERAYWLAFALWREKIPDEWFQWIPAGTKLGPRTFDEWLRDPAWPQWVLVRDVKAIGASLPKIIYRDGDSAILQKEVPPAARPAPTTATSWYFGSTFKLVGFDLARTTVVPGETITLTTYTESIYPPLATVGWRVELIDREGVVLTKSDVRAPFADKYPVQRWPPGKIARDAWTLPVDSRAVPGVYRLQMGLYQRTDGAFVDVHPLFSEGAAQTHLAAAPLAKIKIPIVPPSADELRAALPMQAQVGDHFVLARYTAQVDPYARVVRVTLYWQSVSRTENDYTVFVHLLDSSGKIIAQADAPPRGGTYPTSIWDPQEIVKDTFDLRLPDGDVPLSIDIGMYNQPSLTRLPIRGANGAAIGDHITLDLR